MVANATLFEGEEGRFTFLHTIDDIKWGWMLWTVETLNAVVDAELEALPADMLARFSYISELIESFGLENVREPHVKHLQGPLWEMRLKGRDGISRAIYVTATGRRVVVVRAFVKKTQATPRKELELALKRAKEVTP